MSCTDAALGWLLSLSATCTSSPFRSSSPVDNDFADWLQISPSSSPLQDVSLSARLNLPGSPGQLNYDYAFSGTVSQTAARESSGFPTSVDPTIFNQHHRMVSLDSTTTTLINTPSPRSLVFFSPSAVILPTKLTSPRRALSEASSPASRLIQDLQQSPFGGYYDPNASSLPLQVLSDVSPIVRADKFQEHLSANEKPNTRSKKKKRRTKQTRSTSFVEKLRSAPVLEEHPRDTSFGPPTNAQTMASAFGETSPLLSPCKLAAPLALWDQSVQLESASSSLVDHSVSRMPAPLFISSPCLPSFLDGPLSPLTPLTTSSSPQLFEKVVLPAKRHVTDTSTPVRRSKRSRRTLAAEPSPASDETVEDAPMDHGTTNHPTFSSRTLPSVIELSSNFPLFYRRFPASSYYQPADTDSPCTLFNLDHPGGNYNPPRSVLDLYTPRFVRGKGVEKVGLCPICIEDCSRGGENKKLWLAMKFSAFKCYHMQYAHGISASTGSPFSPPVAFRIVPRPNPGKNEKHEIQQGKCHKCVKWVPVEGIKDMGSKVPELHWWKHAASCHHESRLEGEDDFFEEDEVYSLMISLNIDAGVTGS